MDWFRKRIEKEREEESLRQRRADSKREAFQEVLNLLNPMQTCQQCGTDFWRGDDNSTERTEEIAKHNADKHPKKN